MTLWYSAGWGVYSNEKRFRKKELIKDPNIELMEIP